MRWVRPIPPARRESTHSTDEDDENINQRDEAGKGGGTFAFNGVQIAHHRHLQKVFILTS